MGTDREDRDVSTVSAGPPAGRRRVWKYAVPVIALLAGLVFTAGAMTARGTDLRGGSRTELAELIAAEQYQQQRFQREYQELRAEVDELSRRAGEQDTRVNRARQRAGELSRPAHFTRVRGPGIRVALDDADRRPGQEHPGNPSPNDLVVHEQDVQAVVNALWAGGAEAMQILQGVVYSPPFTVTAIGDPDQMRAALESSREVAIYQQYVDAYGLGYSVRTLGEVTLPGYSGAAEFTYATVR